MCVTWGASPSNELGALLPPRYMKFAKKSRRLITLKNVCVLFMGASKTKRHVKWTVHLKMKILSFIHPHVIPHPNYWIFLGGTHILKNVLVVFP